MLHSLGSSTSYNLSIEQKDIKTKIYEEIFTISAQLSCCCQTSRSNKTTASQNMALQNHNFFNACASSSKFNHVLYRIYVKSTLSKPLFKKRRF